MKKFDVALFGSVFVDHVMTGFKHWPKPGEEVFAESYQREVGGGCFNTACGLAKLGASATCYSIVGRADSQWLRERVRTFGVSTDQLRFSDLPTAATVAVSLAEDRSFFTFDGANRELESWLETPGLAGELAQARHVHFAYPLPPKPGLAMVRALHSLGSTVSLDVGWQEQWLRDENIWPLLAEMDLFLPNEHEAARITGRSGVEEMLRVFAERGARRVVLKMGARGAVLLGAGGIVQSPALPVAVVDTTGAGDAFDAGFLHAFLSGLPGTLCLERGVICGSLSVRKAGSLAAFPSWDEVRQHHEQNSKR